VVVTDEDAAPSLLVHPGNGYWSTLAETMAVPSPELVGFRTWGTVQHRITGFARDVA
jgi:hypothetical protein